MPDECSLPVDPGVRHLLQQQHHVRSPDRRLRRGGLCHYRPAQTHPRRARRAHGVLAEPLRRRLRELRPGHRRRRARAATPNTPKVVLSFQATPRDLYYASWAKGFRVGGGNAPLPIVLRWGPGGGGLSQRRAAHLRVRQHAEFRGRREERLRQLAEGRNQRLLHQVAGHPAEPVCGRQLRPAVHRQPRRGGCLGRGRAGEYGIRTRRRRPGGGLYQCTLHQEQPGELHPRGRQCRRAVSGDQW